MQASLDSAAYVTEGVSRLDIGQHVNLTAEPTAEDHPVLSISECKCGMPLCICEAPVITRDAFPLQKKSTSTFTAQTNSKSKKINTTSKIRGSASKSKECSVFNLGQASNGISDKPQMDYEVNGEGLREAIKNGDIDAVRKLLSKGIDANYCDKQGLSLLHLATLFNQTDIAFTLMEYGASTDCKNAQGETPLDCAPATLQYKMQKKMEEGEQKQSGQII